MINFDFQIKLPYKKENHVCIFYRRTSISDKWLEFLLSRTLDFIRVKFYLINFDKQIGFEIRLSLFCYSIVLRKITISNHVGNREIDEKRKSILLESLDYYMNDLIKKGCGPSDLEPYLEVYKEIKF